MLCKPRSAAGAGAPCVKVTPTPLHRGSGGRFVSAGRKWVESEQEFQAGRQAVGWTVLRQRGLGRRHLPNTAAPSSPCPHLRFHSVPLFCFCIWFCDSFKDTSRPRNSHWSQPSLSCCPCQHMFNPLFSRFCKHTVFFQTSN